MKNQVSFLMSASVNGQFDVQAKQQQVTPIKPRFSHKLIRNGSVNQTPQEDPYKSGSNYFPNSRKASPNPTVDNCLNLSSNLIEPRQGSWGIQNDQQYLNQAELMKSEQSKQDLDRRTKSAGRNNLRQRNLNSNSQNTRVSGGVSGNCIGGHLVFNQIMEQNDDNMRKSQSFKMKQTSKNQSQTPSREIEGDIAQQRKSRNGSQNLASTYLPLRIKLTPRSTENAKSQISQGKSQSSQYDGSNSSMYGNSAYRGNNQQQDNVDALLEEVNKRKVTDAQIRQTRVNQLKNYISSVYTTETPDRPKEEMKQSFQISPLNGILQQRQAQSKQKTKIINSEKMQPTKAVKNLNDLQVNTQLLKPSAMEIFSKNSADLSLVEQIQSKSTEEFANFEFNSNLIQQGYTSTNASSLPQQSLQSKNFKNFHNSAECENGVEEMHYYAVEFQQNCKRWLSGLEHQKYP